MMNKKIKQMGNTQAAQEARITLEKKKLMRAEVEELEMMSRFWRAKHDIMDYSMRIEGMEESYREYLKRDRERKDKMQKEYMEAIKKMQEANTDGAPDLTPQGISEMIEKAAEDIIPDQMPATQEEVLYEQEK